MNLIDPHLLAAAYALDAVSPDERSSFEHHLQQCEECRAELQGFHETAARLAQSVEMAIPTSLRSSILDMADQTPQHRPITQLADRRRWRQRVPSIVAAAALVAAIGGGITAWTEHEQRTELQSQLSAEQTRVSSIIGAPDASTISSAVTGGGTFRVISSPAHGAAVVVGTGLPNLPHQEVYQVWLMHDGVPAHAGFLTSSSAVSYVKAIRGADAVAVTIEPEGGSSAPTGSPIAMAAIES